MQLPPNLSTSDLPEWNETTQAELAELYYQLGERLLAAKNYDRAKSAYQIAIEYQPNLASAYDGIARVECLLGEYRAALVAIDTAIFYHARIDYYYQRTLVIQSLTDRGLTAEGQQIDRVPQNSLDWQLNELEFDRLALANFDRYIEAHPQDPDGYCYRGMYYDRLEHYLLALADFDRAIALKPQEPLFHHARGGTYQKIGNFSAALADYDLAIALEPDLAPIYDNRGEIYRLLGDLPGALADYDRAIEIDPQSVAAYYHRGIVRAELENPAAALADYNCAIEIDPRFVDPYLRRSWIYFRQGKYSEAIADCKLIHCISNTILLANNAYFQAHYLLGVIHSQLGCKHQAISDFTKAIELAPNDLAACYYRGITYRELGNITESDDDFARAKSMKERRLERTSELDETRLYAEGLALYYTDLIQQARSTLNLASLYAKQSQNHRFQLQIATFIAQNY